MIKAIDAYKLMCEAIQKTQPTISEDIETHIVNAADLGLQTATYVMPKDLEEGKIKALISSIRYDGYLVKREGNVITISW